MKNKLLKENNKEESQTWKDQERIAPCRRGKGAKALRWDEPGMWGTWLASASEMVPCNYNGRGLQVIRE